MFRLSVTGVPSSPCFRVSAFCASVNFNAFNALSSSLSQESLAENSSFKLSLSQGAEKIRSDFQPTTINLACNPKAPLVQVFQWFWGMWGGQPAG